MWEGHAPVPFLQGWGPQGALATCPCTPPSHSWATSPPQSGPHVHQRLRPRRGPRQLQTPAHNETPFPRKWHVSWGRG